MNFLKKLPLPIAGLALGSVALGNLVKDNFGFLRPILGIIGLIIVILIAIKFLLLTKPSLEAMENPVIAGTMATYPMAITILSTYLKDMPAKIVYFVGILLHAVLIIWFTLKFVKNFNIKKVFPTWFIMYVGIVAGSVAAPNVANKPLGQILFYFGLVTYLILLIFVIYRVVKVKEIPEVAMPTLSIFAAPASLLLAGYNSSFDVKNHSIVMFLLALSIIFYLVGIFYFIKLIGLKFYPSFSAYTFPFVISAIALKTTNGYLKKIGTPNSLLVTLANIEMYLAIAFVLYVLVRYIIFLMSKEAK